MTESNSTSHYLTLEGEAKEVNNSNKSNSLSQLHAADDINTFTPTIESAEQSCLSTKNYAHCYELMCCQCRKPFIFTVESEHKHHNNTERHVLHPYSTSCISCICNNINNKDKNIVNNNNEDEDKNIDNEDEDKDNVCDETVSLALQDNEHSTLQEENAEDNVVSQMSNSEYILSRENELDRRISVQEWYDNISVEINKLFNVDSVLSNNGKKENTLSKEEIDTLAEIELEGTNIWEFVEKTESEVERLSRSIISEQIQTESEQLSPRLSSSSVSLVSSPLPESHFIKSPSVSQIEHNNNSPHYEE